jgi:hippurate hydrolase
VEWRKDEIYITVKGKGGHAATPQQQILLVFSSHVSLQQMCRNSSPFLHLFYPSAHFRRAYNHCHTTGKTMGTFRTMDESWRFSTEMIEQQPRSIAEG